jgi:hypothetical protein
MGVILELRCQFEVRIEKFTYQIIINCTKQPKHTKDQEVNLSLPYAHSVFEVVDDEDEDGGEEVDGVDDGEGEVELGSGDGQSVDDHDDVALEDVVEVGVVLVVQPHPVVTHDRPVEQHRNDPPDEGGLDGVHLMFVCIYES